jgi:putative DNA methylase
MMNKNARDAIRGWHSRGYLPHFDADEISQSITLRLTGTLPQERVDVWRDELIHLPERHASAERSKRIEDSLDKGVGDCWLRDPRVAQLVEDALLHFDGERYHVHAWVIMPNHVHILMTPTDGYSLSGIIHTWKSYTAKQANRLLQRSGEFWQDDYFDRYIRDAQHYLAAIEYIETNPVRAGLCMQREGWVHGSATRRHPDAAPSRLP